MVKSSRRPAVKKQLVIARKSRKGGIFGKIASHLGAAYMGYKAPKVLGSIKNTVVSGLKKLPGIKQYADYKKNQATTAKLTANSLMGKEQYDAIKSMKFDPFATKEAQINEGTRGSFSFKDAQGNIVKLPRDMTKSDTKDVSPMHKLSESFAKWRGVPNTRPDQGINQNLETFYDAPSSFGGKGILRRSARLQGAGKQQKSVSFTNSYNMGTTGSTIKRFTPRYY